MPSDPTSSSSLLIFIAEILLFALGAVVVALYAYGAIWAFRIRDALMTPLYRERALWVGVVGVFFTTLIASNLLIRLLDPTNFYLSLFQYCIVDAAGIVTLAWIDTTIKLARRLDPLNRNTFKWKQLRIVIWVLTFLTTGGSLAEVIILRINFFTSPSGAGGAFIAGSFGWVLLGFIALLLSYRRSKDPVLKEHLKWFGLFLLLLFIVDTILSKQIPPFRILGEILLALDAYFLYRGARSLAPFSRVPLEQNALTSSR